MTHVAWRLFFIIIIYHAPQSTHRRRTGSTDGDVSLKLSRKKGHCSLDDGRSMDVSTSLLVIVASCALLKVAKWILHRRSRLLLLKRYGIPGPEPCFFSGNLRELRSESTPNDVISRWLARYGDVFGYYIGEIPYVVVKDLDMLKQIMVKEFHSFGDRPEMTLDVWPLNRTIIYLTGRRWKEVRSILTPNFSSGKIKLMANIVRKKVDVSLEVVSEHAEKDEMFDVYELVQGFTLDVIADCALAMKTRCQKNPRDTFLIAVRDFFRYANNVAVEWAIMLPIVKRAMTLVSNAMRGGRMTAIVVDSVRAAIDARRSDPSLRSVDMLQMMLDHGQNEAKGSRSRLTDEELIANAYIFLLAGYETTATALAFTFHLLVRHPEVQARLQREIDAAARGQEGEDLYAAVQGLQYLDQVFEESLRYYPPVTGFVVRKCRTDCTAGGRTIPAGCVVQAPIWDIQHDPELWPDPWTFDPDRFSPERRSDRPGLAHFPFGIGPRACIGERFARTEAKMLLFRLLQNFTFEACERTEEDPLPLVCPTVIINPRNGIFLRARRR